MAHRSHSRHLEGASGIQSRRDAGAPSAGSQGRGVGGPTAGRGARQQQAEWGGIEIVTDAAPRWWCLAPPKHHLNPRSAGLRRSPIRQPLRPIAFDPGERPLASLQTPTEACARLQPKSERRSGRTSPDAPPGAKDRGSSDQAVNDARRRPDPNPRGAMEGLKAAGRELVSPTMVSGTT